MSFASLPFVGLVAAGVILYYLVPKKLQWVVLLLASTVFYLAGGVKSAVWLVLVAAATWLTGLLLARQNARPAPDKQTKAAVRHVKKRICAVCAVLCFGLLYLMKYWNFTASALPSALGDKLPRWDFVVPMGLSYFIFQAVGYVIDVYRGKTDAQKHPLRYGLFVSFFPQMVQGPIHRYGELAPQLFAEHRLQAENLRDGIELMLWGMLKKVLIADTLAAPVAELYGNYAAYPGLIVFLGAALYCLQLYCDFSGGIDIVRGVSELFGIRLGENFRRPYFAQSIDDFWRRWHISLGEWMKDYLFYPLALSKWLPRLCKPLRKHLGKRVGKLLVPSVATVVVFLAVGVWQGPGLQNIAYGLWNGLLMSAAMLCAPLFKKREGRAMQIFRILRTCFLVTIGRFFSRAESLSAAWGMLRHCATHLLQALPRGVWTSFGLSAGGYVTVLLAGLVLFCVSLQQERGVRVRTALAAKRPVVQFLVLVAALFLLLATVYLNTGYTAIAYVYENV